MRSSKKVFFLFALTLSVLAPLVQTVMAQDGIYLPYNGDIKLQQAWYYQDGTYHGAFDYVDGVIDNSSTWQPFTVVACHAGTARYTREVNDPNNSGKGNWVSLTFQFGGHSYQMKYCHLESSFLIEGQDYQVALGQPLGTTGISGAANGVNHLHYLIYQDGVRFDPYGIASGEGDVKKRDSYWPNASLGVNHIFATNPPTAAAPGYFSDGWHTGTSPSFLDCFEDNGSYNIFGRPWNNGIGKEFVHYWPDNAGNPNQPGHADALLVQDFLNAAQGNHWYMLVYNPNLNQAFPVHGQILSFWWANTGYTTYGPPIVNEYFATEEGTNHQLSVQEFQKAGGQKHYLAYDNNDGSMGEIPSYQIAAGGTVYPPENLRTTNVTQTSIDLAWDAGLNQYAGYRVFKDGSFLADTPNLTYAVTNLNAGTTYSFYVKASLNGSYSGPSNTIYVTTGSSGGGTGFLTATSDPSGAEMWFNGSRWPNVGAVTPQSNVAIQTGNVTLTFKKAGYNDLNLSNIPITQGQTSTVHATLQLKSNMWVNKDTLDIGSAFEGKLVGNFAVENNGGVNLKVTFTEYGNVVTYHSLGYIDEPGVQWTISPSGSDGFVALVDVAGLSIGNHLDKIVVSGDNGQIDTVHVKYEVLQAPPSGTLATFAPVGDVSLQAGTNIGGYQFLMPDDKIYLKFNVSGITGPVAEATVRLYFHSFNANGGTNDGGGIYAVSNNYRDTSTPWDEYGIIDSNAPLITGSPLHSVGIIWEHTWVEYDVTDSLTGNGTFSFGIQNQTLNDLYFRSKEHTSGNHPELVVEYTPNAAPVAQNDADTTYQNTAIVVNVPVNDSDSDGTLNLATVVIGTGFVNGTPSVNTTTGAITYTPNTGFTGKDSCTYTIKDNLGATSNVAKVKVTVILPPPASPMVVTPAHDSYVKSSSPTSNYGTSSTIQIYQGSSDRDAYLKFVVTGTNGYLPSTAKLRLRCTSSSSDGGSVYVASNNYLGTQNPWLESGINWNNAPGIQGSALAAIGAVSTGNWYEVIVTSAITGDGTYSFAVSNQASDLAYYSSKEGSYPPQLVLEFTGGGQQNNPPVAVNDTASTPMNTAVVVNVPANDTDSDGSLNLTTVTVTQAFAHGSSSVNATTGVITFTPTTGYVGLDSCFYTIKDDDGATSNAAKVRITVTSGGGSTTLTFNPSHDATVESVFNQGSYSWLEVENDVWGTCKTYLKFDVTGITGTVTSAKVRLYCIDAGSSGGGIYSVSNTYQGSGTAWVETGITSSNAPTISGSPLSSVGSVSTSTWVEYPVTTAITGNGTFSFAISASSTDLIQYRSKEATSNKPELVITVALGKVGDLEQSELVVVPTRYELFQNYPNPFNPETVIKFALPEQQIVHLAIYNIVGQKVRTLVDGVTMNAVYHTVVWDGRSDSGSALPSGVYFYQLQAGQFQQVRKMVLVK